MGLLYKLFKTKPTTINEFKDALSRKNLHEVTIRVGSEYYGNELFPSVRAYVEFSANGIILRQHFGSGFNYLSPMCERERLARSETDVMMYVLNQRKELQMEGRNCQILLGDKTLDASTEREWMKQATKLRIIS